MPRRVLPLGGKMSAPRIYLNHGSRFMSITVKNTRPDTPIVTLFGELQDGSFVAKVMREDAVPYGHRWDNEIDQAMVYIEPSEEQLAQILAALNERRLPFGDLQNYGSSAGGTSTLPV
jgi:hypothetical protein